MAARFAQGGYRARNRERRSVILVLLALICIAGVPLSGRSLRPLADIELRWLWLPPVALAVQVVILVIVPGGSHTLHAIIHVATYVMLLAFIWANRRLPGAIVTGTGAALNALAIAVNGGVMPRSSTAQRLAGLHVAGGFHNAAVLAHPNLLALGDVIPVPWPHPFQNVLSVGDLLIFVGLLILLYRVCPRPAPAPAAPELDNVYAGAVLSALHTSVATVFALWQGGEASDSPTAGRARAAFATCRRAVAGLGLGDPMISYAVDSVAAELEAWAAGAPFDHDHERSLTYGEQILMVAPLPFQRCGSDRDRWSQG
jgi:uncharacterized protein DUF5317